MKKIIAIINIVLISGSILLSSCQSHNQLCPAYQPSMRDASSIDQNIGNANETAGNFDQEKIGSL